MKLTDLLPNNETAIVAEIKIPDEYKLIDQFVPRVDGGKIYRMDRITKKITEVFLREVSHVYVLGDNNNPKLDLEPGSNYVEAVNLKNATRKLLAGKFHFQTK